LAAILLAGCGTQLPGVVSPDGYASGRYPLNVRKGYDAPAAAGLMPEGWKLDNFNGDSPKDGKAYQTTIRIDANNDGDFEQQEDGPAFELRFVHLRQAQCGCWRSAWRCFSRRRRCNRSSASKRATSSPRQAASPWLKAGTMPP
jgi:hypothetical protein